MNKLFARIASITAGLALVVGAGVALASHAEAKGVKADSATANFTLSSAAEVTVDGVTASFAKGSGSTAPAWYAAGLRLYINNTVTISSSNTITGVSFNWEKQGSKDFITGCTADVGTYSHPTSAGEGTWSGSATSITFSLSGSGKQLQLNTFSVTYSTGGGGEEDPVLQSITVSGEKTAYTVGDEFVKPTVTATYDKGDPKDVTASATCSGYNMGVAGEYTVTVSYGGKTTTYDIVVSAAEPAGDVLYSATFTDVATHSYTQNKEFTLNEKDWVASVSQVNGGVFYLGCNSTHAAKGILNDNTSFSDVVTALAAADTPYGSAVATAHAYALRFDNAYDNVGSVTFTWAGGNNAFQVYLFGDRGDGLEVLGHTDYATSGTAVSGQVSWAAEEYGESFNSFVIVARPGATGSTATNKTLRAATFQIVAGEEEPIDPGLKTMVIKNASGSSENLSVVYGESAASFYAYENSDEVSNVTWSTNDTAVLSVSTVSGHAAVIAVSEGSAKLIAEAEGYNKAEVTVSVDIGEVDEIVVSGSMSKTAYTSNESWSNAGLIATAVYTTGYEKVVTDSATWTYSPESPADGVTSVVARATFGGQSGDSAAQAVTVTVAHAGTAEDPFTVAEALAKCTEIGAVGNTGQGPWVTTGIISRVTSAPAATYWNATYYISDDGSQNNELQVYRGFYLDNAKFDATTALLMKAGMVVTVTGNLTGSYGSEYCQGNYLLSIEEPSTGDITVTFEPNTSLEIGDAGDFTASTTATNPTYTWSVEDSNILSVDEDTGEFEALALGVTKVTVNVNSDEGKGEASAYITVNAAGVISVPEAYDIAASLDGSKEETTPYYVYVQGYVSQFDSDGKTRALTITDLDETQSIMVYVGSGSYSSFIDGLALGDHIVVKANVQNYKGTYELKDPVKVSSNYSAVSLAFEILNSTKETCDSYVDGESDYNEFKTTFEALWSTLSGKYTSLTDKEVLEKDAKPDGTTVEQALYRYDFLTAKYQLDGFINGHDSAFRIMPTYETSTVDSNVAIMVVTIVAITSISAIGVILVIKRRKAIR